MPPSLRSIQDHVNVNKDTFSQDSGAVFTEFEQLISYPRQFLDEWKHYSINHLTGPLISPEGCTLSCTALRLTRT